MSIHYRYQHHHHHHRHHQHGMDTPKISETLKTQATTALKLIKTVVEFSQKLASIYDQHANSLRTASDTFRKKTNDVLTKENREDEAPALLGSIWKTILQDTENEAEANSALAKAFTEYLVIPLQDCGNQQKQIIKKLTNYQEEFEDKMTKTKESLTKCQKEYHDNWTKAKSKDPANKSSAMLSCYHAHNEYLLQLTAINHFLKKYYLLVLPEILSDHDEFHIQLAKSVAQCLSLALRTGKNKTKERSKRLESIMDMCSAVNKHDESGRVPTAIRRAMKGQPRDYYNYIIPDHGVPAEFLTEELISNDDTRDTLRRRHSVLKKEANELEVTVSYSEKAVEALLNKYEDYLETNNYAKANELKEEILKLKQAKRNAKSQLAICKEQLKLFTSEVLTDSEAEAQTDYRLPKRKVSAGDGKEPNGRIPEHGEPPSSPRNLNAKCNGSVPSGHSFQEHTFKKATSCAHCSEPLTGTTKQGFKCVNCKIAVHHVCQSHVAPCKKMEGKRRLSRQNSFTALSQFTKKNLLRRQRSLTDIFLHGATKDQTDSEASDSASQKELDFVYETIKCAKSLSGPSQEGAKQRDRAYRSSQSDYDTDSDIKSVGRRSSVASTLSVASTSSVVRPQDARRSIMKGRSISLDSPEPSTISQTGLMRRRNYAGSESKRSVSLPSDPQQGRVVYQHHNDEPKTGETSQSMSYVALEDVGDTKKGDLPIRAGDMVHVLDKTNKDWWMVKRETETGFVPVQCLEKVQPWERVLRVARTYTAPEHSDQISLKRNQVVIQISNVDNGWTIVKASDKRTGRFPYQYLSPMLRRQSTVST